MLIVPFMIKHRYAPLPKDQMNEHNYSPHTITISITTTAEWGVKTILFPECPASFF